MLHRKSKALQLGQFLALLASLLIAGQIGFILYQGNPFCLNGGCRVVEQFSKVSPLVFNVVGMVFFMTLFLGLRASHNEMRRVPQFVAVLLLAGLVVEGVLISFQYLVAHAFCAYCLGVFAFIVVLNLLLGAKQAASGLVLFAAASLSFSSLELNQSPSGDRAFTAGIFADRAGSEKQPEHFLFFSSTCAHCERVIASLKENKGATIHFNPIDQVKGLDLPGITLNSQYSPTANKALLTALAIDEIPVLMTRTPEGLSIRKGTTAILAYLGATGTPRHIGQSIGSSTTSGVSAPIPGLEGKDGCTVTADCTDGKSASRQPAN